MFISTHVDHCLSITVAVNNPGIIGEICFRRQLKTWFDGIEREQ